MDAIHPVFSDGTSQSGVYNSATITTLDPKAIQINLKYLNIKITIRQVRTINHKSLKQKVECT